VKARKVIKEEVPDMTATATAATAAPTAPARARIIRSRIRAALGTRTAAAAATAATVACLAAGLAGAPLAQASTARPAGTTAASPILWGTLDTDPSHVAAENAAGIKSAMFEFSWASFEPSPGRFSASYLAAERSLLAAYQAAGSTVTLGLGMENTPSWVTKLADATYVDEHGDVSSETDFVFSAAVRNAAARYLTQISRYFPLSDFYAIRIDSGGDSEMLYPGDHDGYWAFSHAALTGQGLPAGMTANPDPRWRPGQAGLTKAQLDAWINWYIGGLDNLTNWEMNQLSTLGFTGYFETVTPGSGSRPSDITADENANLGNDDNTTEVGAVWDRYYAMLTSKSRLIAYISSVADNSGNDDTCTPADTTLPLTSATMDSWSATRWIARIAHANNLLVGGENAGYTMPASLDGHYLDNSADGMMADAIRQAQTCGFTAFYWAHDVHLWDGKHTLAQYTTDITQY
jgi:hypothetical protein